MRLTSLLAAVLSLSSGFLRAQTFDWVATAGGTLSDKTRCITLDRQGNVFMAGEMNGDGTFGDLTTHGAGGSDFFLTKVSPAGKFVWARTLGGSLVDRGYGVATDPAGNSYVTGHYQSTDVMVDGQPLPNAGDYDVFVAKYDPDGKMLWIRTAGGKGYDYGHGIVVDGEGSVIVTGAVVGEARFGDTVLSGARPIFCAKYDADGKLIWVRGSSGAVSCSGHGVAVDNAGNIYLGGMTAGTGTFGKVPLTAGKTTAALVAKLSPAGEVLWIKTLSGTPSAVVHEITADASGRVWVAGIFKGKLEAGAESWSTTGDKDSDGFLAHFDTDGQLQWTRVIQGKGTDYMLGVAADGAGGVFATGEFSNDALFMGRKLPSAASTSILVASLGATGDLRWLSQAGGTKAGNAYTMATDGKGTLVVGGACSGPATFGDTQVGATKGADLYGARMQVPSNGKP